MIKKEQDYKVTLIDCNGKEAQVAKYLQILTGMERDAARKIVTTLPCVLYERTNGEVCSYLEEAFDFYTVQYEMDPLPENTDDQTLNMAEYPSRQVLVLGSMVDYIGKRTEYSSLARKYDFKANVNLNDTPFLVKDGLTPKQAEALKQDLRNMGMSAQILRSAAEVQQVKKRGLFGWKKA